MSAVVKQKKKSAGSSTGATKKQRVSANSTRAKGAARKKGAGISEDDELQRAERGSKTKRIKKAQQETLTNESNAFGEKKNKRKKVEIKGILLTAVGILMMVAFFKDGSIGYFGTFVRSFFFGLFGWPAYFVPSAIIIVGVLTILANEGNKLFGLTFFYIFMLFVTVSALLHTSFYVASNYTNLNPLSALLRFYLEAQDLNGGGFLGGLLAMPFLTIFHVLGAQIILIAILLIDLILLTNISVAAFLRSVGKTATKGAKKVQEYHRNHAEQGEPEDDESDGEGLHGADDAPGGLEIDSEYGQASQNMFDVRIGDEMSSARDLGELDMGAQFTKGRDAEERYSGEWDDEIRDTGDESPYLSKIKEPRTKLDELKDRIAKHDTVATRLGRLTTGKAVETMPGVLVKSRTDRNNLTSDEPVLNEEEEDELMGFRRVERGEKKPPVKSTRTPKKKKTELPGNEGEETIVGTSGVPYRAPAISLLADNPDNLKDLKKVHLQTQDTKILLEETLESFKVRAKVVNISRGPSVTRYDLKPDIGVKVSTITNLADDISLKLAASGVRISPVAGMAAIGIEVPNKEVSNVVLRDIIDSDEFRKSRSPLTFAIGKDISGNTIISDIAKMPHLLIAGATGSGKSVCINCLIISLLYKSSPDDVKLIMIDPKVVELGMYNGIPHLMIPVVTDPKKASGALAWAVREMLNRYKLFSELKVKTLAGYNEATKSGEEPNPLPRLVIIIDELADLMMAAPKEVEESICRLAQMGRAAGIHLVIATQRPSVDVITGLIKANIPSRLACAVSSQVDSRTILDVGGAEKLLGRGDMLFHPQGENRLLRIQGAFVSENEVEDIVSNIRTDQEITYDNEMIEEITSVPERSKEDAAGDNDELLPKAIELVVNAGQASVSMLQRRFKVGYSRAARMIDQMEERGIVSGFDGSKPRQILISKQQFYEMKF